MMGGVHLVTLPAELLVGTHLLAAFAGAATMYAAVVHWIPRMLERRHHRPDERGSATVPNRKLRRGAWVAIVLLVASGMVIAIGIMAALQRAHDKHVAEQRAEELTSYGQCISEWGAKLARTINANRQARVAYDTAAQARSDAVAEVIRVVIGLRVTPPVATDAELTDTLEAARLADDRADAAKRALDHTVKSTKYQPPVLTCGKAPGKGHADG